MGGGDEEEEVEKVGVKMEMKMETMKVLLPLLVKRRVEKWRVMMEEEEGDVDAVVEDSEVIEEGSVLAAELGELEEDLGEEEEDSVEAMTEEKAALNSAICFAITSFQTTSSTTSSADFFSFHLQKTCSLEILLL